MKKKSKGAKDGGICRECGGRQSTARESYYMILAGTWGATLENTTVIHCEGSAHTGVEISRMGPLMNGIAAAVVAKKARLAPAEITFLRDHIGYTGVRLARALGVTNGSVSRWEHGHEPIGAQPDRLLRALVALLGFTGGAFDAGLLESIEDGPGVPLRLTLRQDQGGEWEAVAA